LLLKGTSRVVSDELDIDLIQADCPRDTDIFTVVLLQPTSIQLRFEEFPASSEVFFPNIYIEKILGSNSISSTVHPVPAPFSTKALNNNKANEGGNNQNEILFNRGNAINCVIA
jgi:hypothetical protein